MKETEKTWIERKSPSYWEIWDMLVANDDDLFEGISVCPECRSNQIKFNEDEEIYHCFSCSKEFPFPGSD